MAKAMTVRLDDDKAEELEKVAEAVRQVIAEHVAARSAYPEFRKRLRASIERHDAILKRLAQ